MTGFELATCTIAEILPLLLGDPRLYVSDDPEEYKNWILVGLDLNLRRDRLNEMKQTARAKGAGPLYGVVTDVVEEWFRGKVEIGQRAFVADLVDALQENHLEIYADLIKSAFGVLAFSPPPRSASLASTVQLPTFEQVTSESWRNDQMQMQQQQQQQHGFGYVPPLPQANAFLLQRWLNALPSPEPAPPAQFSATDQFASVFT